MKNHHSKVACIAALTILLTSSPREAKAEAADPPAALQFTLAAREAGPAIPAEPAAPPKPRPARGKEMTDEIAKAAKHATEAATRMELTLASSFNDRNESVQALVLPRETGDAQIQSETQEDLNVMERILEKATSSHEERNARAMGIYIRNPFGSAPALRSLYIEGHGALFFLNVNYLLSPAANKEEEETKDDSSAEWEEARRELDTTRGSNLPYIAAPAPINPGWAGPAAEYDADKVEKLQKNLIQSLKNAVHIRSLKPDETVTVVVIGRDPSGAGKSSKSKHRAHTATNSRRGDKLMIRAKKSDIESFQNEKQPFEDFRKKVTIVGF